MSVAVDESSRASLRPVGRYTGILFGSETITWLLSAAVLPSLYRVIGPTRMGQFAVALSLLAIVSVVSALGMSTLVTLESARDNEQSGRLIGPVVRARVLSSIAAWTDILFSDRKRETYGGDREVTELLRHDCERLRAAIRGD